MLNEKQLQAWLKSGQPIAGKSDGGGLTFTLSANGTATWIFRYRALGRGKELTLGNYPDMPLKTARKLATKARVEVDQGIDVAFAKREAGLQAKKAITVTELSNQFLDREIRPRYKHPGRVESLMKRDILPVLGRLAPLQLTPADVDRVLRRILSDGRPTVANDALGLMRAMFRFGKKRGILDTNPAADFELRDAGGEEHSRVRKLSHKEITTLFQAIAKAHESFGRDNDLAVKLLLALGVRKMELLASKWEEFELDDEVWHLPGERTKTGRPIDVPLAGPVVAWLREMHTRACGNAFVFPRRRTAKRFPHVSPDTLNAALHNLPHGLEPFSVHDFRRTMRSELSSLGVPPHVAERCLNHAIKGVEGTYDRHSYFEERRQALSVWADLLLSLEKGESYKVIGFPSRIAA